MNNLRHGSTLLFALLVSVNIAWAQQPAPAAPKARVVPAIAQNKDTQAAITPAIALKMLKDGNARFTSGTMMKRDPRKQMKATGSGQYPFASVVSCIDSRAAPELVFDQGIGDIFSARIAGNFVNDDIIGSLAVQQIRDKSPVLREMADKGEIEIVGAMLDVKTGKVTFYDRN